MLAAKLLRDSTTRLLGYHRNPYIAPFPLVFIFERDASSPVTSWVLSLGCRGGYNIVLATIYAPLARADTRSAHIRPPSVGVCTVTPP